MCPYYNTGCVSDTQLWKSGFPNQLQKDDDIIADSGFIIEDLLVPLGVKLNSPLFLGKQDQLVGSEVVETQHTACCITPHPHLKGNL